MRTPTPSNNAARRAIALLHKFRRVLRAYVVGGNARSEQQHERLYRDAIGSTVATHQRRSIGRPATDQFALRGAAANARSTNTDIPAPAEDTQTAEPGSRLNNGPNHPRAAGIKLSEPPARTTQPPATFVSSPTGINAPSIRRASLGRCRTRRLRAGRRARPAARVGCDPESAGTIASVAHELETRAAEVDNHARAQLHDDILALDDELATVKTLLGNEVDWDAENGRLLAGEIPPFQIDADDEDGEYSHRPTIRFARRAQSKPSYRTPLLEQLLRRLAHHPTSHLHFAHANGHAAPLGRSDN